MAELPDAILLHGGSWRTMKAGILAAAAIACCPALALAQDQNNEFRKFIAGMVPKATKAFASKDIAFFQKMTAADFSFKQYGRPVSPRKAALGELKMMFDSMKTIKVKDTVLSASAAANVGTVKIASYMIGVSKPTPQDKKARKVEMWSYTRETWTRTPEGWKLKMIEETKPGKMTMDGKPYNPAGGG